MKGFLVALWQFASTDDRTKTSFLCNITRHFGICVLQPFKVSCTYDPSQWLNLARTSCSVKLTQFVLNRSTV